MRKRPLFRDVSGSMVPWQGIELLEPRQLLANVFWDGEGGDFLWHNPLNWSGDVLPGPDDDVIINVPGAVNIVHSEGQTLVRSITSHEAIYVSGGSIAVSEVWRQYAHVFLAGGEMGGAGNIVLARGGEWSGGSMTGTGRTQLTAGEFRITGDVVLGRELVNDSLLVWEAGSIEAHGARIHNMAERTFLIHSSGTLAAASGESWIFNAGTLALERGAAGTTRIEIGLHNHARRIEIAIFLAPSVMTLAPGTVDVRSGVLEFSGQVLQKQGSVLRGGNWWVTGTDAQLLLPGPDITHVESFTGGGTTIVLRGEGSSFPQLATATFVPSLELENRAFPITFPVQLFQLTINNPGMVTHLAGDIVLQRLDLLGGHLVVERMTASVLHIAEEAVFTANGHVQMERGFAFQQFFVGASIFGDGTLRIPGTLSIGAGNVTVATTLITPTGRLNVAGDATNPYFPRNFSSRIVNYGVIEWSGQDTWRIFSELVNRGMFNIRATGFVETSAGTMGGSAPAIFHNFGTVNVLDGANVTFRGAGGGVRLVNRGHVRVNDGILNLFGGVYGGSQWTIAPNSELAIGGLSAALTDAHMTARGTLRIGTTLNLTGGEVWNPQSILSPGSGALIIGPFGHLRLQGASSMVFHRTTTINHGILSTADNLAAGNFGNFTNHGTLILGGALSVNTFTASETSTIRIRSTGLGNHGSISSTSFHRAGRLFADFFWDPPTNPPLSTYTELEIYHVIFPASLSGQFSSFQWTGLNPGKTVFHFDRADRAGAQTGILQVAMI
jgi:hypothetical protein